MGGHGELSVDSPACGSHLIGGGTLSPPIHFRRPIAAGSSGSGCFRPLSEVGAARAVELMLSDLVASCSRVLVAAYGSGQRLQSFLADAVMHVGIDCPNTQLVVASKWSVEDRHRPSVM